MVIKHIAMEVLLNAAGMVVPVVIIHRALKGKGDILP